MPNPDQEVAHAIRLAFKDVTLGDGIGLKEGQGLDDYASSETLAEYRASDEKLDWSRIEISDLNTCYSSLSFFDPKGMRFHLPAYLIADIEGTLRADILFHLCHAKDEASSRFSLLNKVQKDAIQQFLCLKINDPRYYQPDNPIRQMILDSLKGYWSLDRE